jgi:hypothetical protein
MKKIWITLGAITAFIIGYGSITSQAFPSGGVYSRGEWRGYFSNTLDTAGTNVLPSSFSGEAMPSSINSASEFVAFIRARVGHSNQQLDTGATFIVNTMLGRGRSGAPAPDRTPSSAMLNEWENMVVTAANHGHVTWRTNFSYVLNSYYQGPSGGGATDDDAFYDNSGTFPAIVFEDEFGRVAYAIKWQCANPVGFTSYTLESPWDITGSSYLINGAGDDSRASGGQINTYVGDTLRWTHTVQNAGPSFTNPTTIDAWSDGTPRFTIGVMAASGATSTRTYNDPPYVVPIGTPPGTNICRRGYFNPTSSTSNADGFSGAPCARVLADYNLVPDVSPSTTEAEAGDTITFTYTIANTGTTDSVAAQCSVRDGGGVVVPGLTLNCSASHVFPAGTTANDPPDSPVGTENYVVPANAVGTTVCRQLRIAPATPSVASADSVLRCVTIVAKPYMRVYGGDVSAGNGLSSSAGTCTSNPNAVVVGWNRGDTGVGSTLYGGAGAQYAVMALNRVQWFSSALGNTGGAPEPRGLTFAANTTSSTVSGFFGGLFGSLPCVSDYYASRPASTLAIPATVAGMTSGIYGGTGPITLGGGSIVNPNNRITVYVSGDVYITSSVSYSGSWDVTSMPLFRLIAQGNIYIDNGVSQLDGLYIAQRNGASGGVIYTCTTSAAPLPPATPSFYADCDDQKLTVNGAFIAHQVQFGRTRGTVSLGVPGESGAGGNAGEVFNYSPIMWIPQPTGTGNAGYDAITTLPPVL